MALSYPLGITRCAPQEKMSFIAYNKSAWVKMAGYRPRSFLRVYVGLGQ